MAESYDLTDPVTQPAKTTSNLRIVAMTMDRESVDPLTSAQGRFHVRLRDNLDNAFEVQYVGGEAKTIIQWINTANFSTTSMNKRVLQKLSQDGKIPPGTATGTPEPATPPPGME